MAGLPRDSAVVRAVDPEGHSWGTTEELLATLIEVVDVGHRLYIQRHLRRGARLPKPLRVTRPKRPGDPPEPPASTRPELPPAAAVSDMRRFFGG